MRIILIIRAKIARKTKTMKLYLIAKLFYPAITVLPLAGGSIAQWILYLLLDQAKPRNLSVANNSDKKPISLEANYLIN